MELATSPLGLQLEAQANELCRQKGWALGEFLGAGASAAVFEVETQSGPRALKIFSPQYLTGKRGELVKRRLDLVLKELCNHNCPFLIQIYEGGAYNGR